MGRKQNVYAGSAKQTKLLQRVQLILVVVAMLVSMVQPFTFFPVAAEEVTPEVQENSATGGASEKDGETAEKTSDAAEPVTEVAAEQPGADAAKPAEEDGAEVGSSAGTAEAAAEAGTEKKTETSQEAQAAANEAEGKTAADAAAKAGTEGNTGNSGEVPAAADKTEGQTAAEESGETATEENEEATTEAAEGQENEEAAAGDKETEEASADEEDSSASTEEEAEDDADDHEDADELEEKRSSQNGRPAKSPAKAPAGQNDPKSLAVYLYKEGQESAGTNSENIEGDNPLEKDGKYFLPEGVPLNLLLQLIQQKEQKTLKISVTGLNNKKAEDLIDNVHYGLNRNEFTVKVGDQIIRLKKDENGSYVFTGSIDAASDIPTSANMETNIYLGGLKGDYGDGIKLSIEYGDQKFESDFAITKRKYNDSISIGGLGNKTKDQSAPYPVIDGGPTDDTPEDGNRVLEETARIVDATVNWGKAPLEKNGEPNKDAFIDPVLRSGQGGDTVALDSLNITVNLPEGKDAEGKPIYPEYIKNGNFHYCDNGNGTLTLTLTREQIKKTLRKGDDGKYYFCEKGYDSEGQTEGKEVELKQADLNDVVLKNGKDLVYVVKDQEGKVKRYAVEEQLVKQLEKSGFYLIGNAIYKKDKPTDTKYTKVAIYQKNEEGKWGFVEVGADGQPTNKARYYDHKDPSDVEAKENNDENKTYLTEITAESILHFTEKYQAKYGEVFNKVEKDADGKTTETAAQGVREVVGGQTETDVTRRNIWVTREEKTKDESGTDKTEQISYYNGTIIDTAKAVILDASKKVVSVIKDTINDTFEIIKNALIDEKGERYNGDPSEITIDGNTVTRDGQDYVKVKDDKGVEKEYRLVEHAVFKAVNSVKTFLEGFSWFSPEEKTDEEDNKKVNQVGNAALSNSDNGKRLVVDKDDKVQNFTAKKNADKKWEFTLLNGTTDSKGKPKDITVSEGDDKAGVNGKDDISVDDKSALIDSNLRKISEKKDDGSYEGYAGVKDNYYYDGKRYVPIGYHYDETKKIYVKNDGTTNVPSYEQAKKAIKEGSQGRYYYKDLIDISLNPGEKEELAEKDAKTLENVTQKTHYSGSTDEKDYVRKGDDGKDIYVKQKDGDSTYFVNVKDGHDILSDQEKKDAIFKTCKDKEGNEKKTYLGQGDIYDYYDKYFRHIKLSFPKFLAGPAFAYDAEATLSGTYTNPYNKKTKDAISNKDLNEGAERTKAADNKRFTLKNIKPQDQNFGKKRPDEFNNNAKMNFDLFNLLFRSGKGRDGKWRDKYLKYLLTTDPAELSAENAKRLQQIRESFRQRYGAELQWGILDDGSEGLLYAKKNADGTTTTVEAKRSLDWTIFLNSTAKDGYPEADNEQLVFYDFHLDPRLVYDAVTINLPRLFFDTLKHVLRDRFHGDSDYAYLDDVEEVSFGVNPNYQRSRYLQVSDWKINIKNFITQFVAALNQNKPKDADGKTIKLTEQDISGESGLVQGPEDTPLQKFIKSLIGQPVKDKDGAEQDRNKRYVDLTVENVEFGGKDDEGKQKTQNFNVRIDTVLGRISIGIKDFFSKNLKDESGKITEEKATIGSGDNKKEVMLKDGYSPVQLAYAQQLASLKETINDTSLDTVDKLKEKLKNKLGDAPCGETLLASIDTFVNENSGPTDEAKFKALKDQLTKSLDELALLTDHMKADKDGNIPEAYDFLNRSFNALRITLKKGFKLHSLDNPQTQVKMDVNTVIADQVEVPFTDEYGQDLTNYELYLRDEIASLLKNDGVKDSTNEKEKLGLTKEQMEKAKKIDLTKPDTVDSLVQSLSEAQYRKLYSLAHQAMAEKNDIEIKKLVSEDGDKRKYYNRARMGKDLSYEDLQGYYEKDSEIKSGLREEANVKRKTLVNGYYIEEEDKNGEWTGVEIKDKKYDIQTPALLNQKINLIAYYLQQQGYNGAYFGNEAAYRLQTEKAPATIFNSGNAWKKTRCHDGILPCVVIEGGDAASGKTPDEDKDSDMNVARDRVTITYETSEGPDSENPQFHKNSPRENDTIRIKEDSWQNPDKKTVEAFRESLESNYTNTDLRNLYDSMKKGMKLLIAWNKAASKDGQTEAGAYLSQEQIDMLNDIKGATKLREKANSPGGFSDEDLKTIMAAINVAERCIDFSLEMKVDALSRQAKIDHLKLVENKTAEYVKNMKIEGDYNENGYRVVKNGFLFDLIPNGLLPYYTDKDGQIKNTLQMKLNITYKNLINEGSVDDNGKYIGPNKDLFVLEDGKLKMEDGKPVLNKESKLYKQLSAAMPVYKDVKSLLEELKKEGEGEGSKYQLLLNSLKAAGIDVEKLPEDQQAIIVWLPEFEAPHKTGPQFKLDIKGFMASETAQFGKKKNLGISQIGHDFVPFTLTGEKDGNINKYLRVLDAEGKAITDQLADDKDGWFKGTSTLHFGDKFDYRITYSYQGVSNTSSVGGTDGRVDKFGIKDFLPAYYTKETFQKILVDIKAKNAGIKDEDKLKELLNSGDFSPRLIAPIEITEFKSSVNRQKDSFSVVYYDVDGRAIENIPSLEDFKDLSDERKAEYLKLLAKVRSFEIKVKEGHKVSPDAGVDVRLQMQMPETDIELKDGKYQLSNGDVIDLKKYLEGKEPMSISNRAFYGQSDSNPVTITLKDETLIKLIKKWKDAQGKDVTPKKEDKDGKGENQPGDGNASEGGSSEAGTGNGENPASPAKPETRPSFPEVTVEIYRQYWDEEAQTYKYELENGQRKVYKVVKLNAENGYELTIKDLPRRKTKTENIISSDGKNSVGTETVLYSYRYVVRELPVPGYVGTVLGDEYQILDETRDATGLVRIIENKPEKPEKPEKPREPKEPPTPPTPGEPPKEPRKKSTRAVDQLPKTASAAAISLSGHSKAQSELSLQSAEADAEAAPQQAKNVAGIGLLLSSLSLAFGAFLLSRKNR